jgi:hypothetical protein
VRRGQSKRPALEWWSRSNPSGWKVDESFERRVSSGVVRQSPCASKASRRAGRLAQHSLSVERYMPNPAATGPADANAS